MSFSLYDATVPVFRQILQSELTVLERAAQWCAANRDSEHDIVVARLAPDMFPLQFQVKLTAVHSLGAILSLPQGSFSPDRTPPPDSIAGLKARVAETLEGLAAISPDDVNSFVGREMRFEFGANRIDFLSVEAFLMSFSLPNFMFHAVTAYDVLRMKGLPVGKLDFLGKMAIKI